MSKPRGNRCQRELIADARALLGPHGIPMEVDFSARDGHQLLLVRFPGEGAPVRLHLVGTPRSVEMARTQFSARLRRMMRERGLGA
jgi:hypothetical protein